MPSIVSTLGSGSGLDIAQLTSSLVDAQFADRLTRLTRRDSTLDAQIGAAATLQNQFASLAFALGARVRGGNLAGAPVSSNPSVLTAAAVEGAHLAGLDAEVEVVRLAKAQTLASPPLTGDVAPGPGTLTIRLGRFDGADFTPDTRAAIVVEVAQGQSLESLARAIDQASGGAVSASSIRSSDGTRLMLKGATGAANGFIVTAQESATPGLGALTYPGATTLGEAAGDSRVRVDGIAVDRGSNRVADAIGGVTLDLLSADVGRGVHLSLARPAAAIGSALGDFVSALNEVRVTLASAADPKTGELRTDGAARAAGRALTQLTSTDLMPNAPAGAPRTLAELGVRTARDGTLSLDRAQFDRVTVRDPAAVEALFAPGLHGLAAAVERMARTVTSPAAPGSLAGSIERYVRLKSTVAVERTRLDDSSARLRQTMTRQFATMDGRVAAFRSTQSFLDNQIKAWNAGR